MQRRCFVCLNFILIMKTETFFWNHRVGQNWLVALISSSVLPSNFCFHPLFRFLYSSEAHLRKKGYRQLLELKCTFLKLLFHFFSSITVPLLTYLNSKRFLKKPVSLHNYIGICRMPMILILIGLFGDICMDIGSFSSIRLWSLLTKLMRSKIKLFWGGYLFLSLWFCTSPIK